MLKPSLYVGQDLSSASCVPVGSHAVIKVKGQVPTTKQWPKWYIFIYLVLITLLFIQEYNQGLAV